MRRDERFPGDQAEIVFSDPFVEQLAELTFAESESVLAEVVRLAESPGGKHALGRKLAGFNTVEVLGGAMRVVYRCTVPSADESGLIEVLCVGPRRDSEVYDLARSLLEMGAITAEELTQIWDALEALDQVAESVGLDGWDYAPEPAEEGLVKAAVGLGLGDESMLSLLSQDEIVDAMKRFGSDSPENLIGAVLNSRVGVVRPDPLVALRARAGQRCGKWMPRAKARCVRSVGHPGACRRQ